MFNNLDLIAEFDKQPLRPPHCNNLRRFSLLLTRQQESLWIRGFLVDKHFSRILPPAVKTNSGMFDVVTLSPLLEQRLLRQFVHAELFNPGEIYR